MAIAPKQFRPRQYAQRQQIERSWSSRRAEYRGLYNEWRWRKPNGMRQQVLNRYPICAWCLTGYFRVTPATQADHIKPHKGDESLFWDMDNCQGLCFSCHSRKTRIEMEHGKRVVVCGPPNSGKTTYVKRNKGAGALVWDADDIVLAMTGRGRHDWPEEMPPIIASMLEGLARGLQHADPKEAWIIVSDHQRAQDVAQRIGASIVEMGGVGGTFDPKNDV